MSHIKELTVLGGILYATIATIYCTSPGRSWRDIGNTIPIKVGYPVGDYSRRK